MVQESADQVRTWAKNAGFEERVVLQAGSSGFDWRMLPDIARETSFFSPRRLIDLRVPSGKPGTEGGKILVQFAKEPLEDTILLLTMGAIPWQERKTAWFKTVSEKGTLLETTPPDRAALPAWLKSRLSMAGLTASQDAVNWMADRVEGNLLAAHQEIQKLAMTASDEILSLEQMQSTLADSARFTAEQLSDALLTGESSRYWRILDGLKETDEPLPLLLWRLAEDCRTLARLKMAVRAGESVESACQSQRLFYDKRAKAKRWLSGPVLPSVVLTNLADIDRQIKGLLSGNPWETLQQLPFLASKTVRSNTTSKPHRAHRPITR